jgi:hypothetical protein
VPHVLLNQQGRARPAIASLYSWRYAASSSSSSSSGGGLGNLPNVSGERSAEEEAVYEAALATAKATPSGDNDDSGAAAIAIVEYLHQFRYSKSLYARSNPGLRHAFQFVDVPDFNGRGESSPTPFFYQNLGEAE